MRSPDNCAKISVASNNFTSLKTKKKHKTTDRSDKICARMENSQQRYKNTRSITEEDRSTSMIL